MQYRFDNTFFSGRIKMLATTNEKERFNHAKHSFMNKKQNKN